MIRVCLSCVSLSLERLPLEHGADRELEALLLPEDLVEVVIVAHARVVDHPVPDVGQLRRQQVVGRADDLVQVRRNLHSRRQTWRAPEVHTYE